MIRKQEEELKELAAKLDDAKAMSLLENDFSLPPELEDKYDHVKYRGRPPPRPTRLAHPPRHLHHPTPFQSSPPHPPAPPHGHLHPFTQPGPGQTSLSSTGFNHSHPFLLHVPFTPEQTVGGGGRFFPHSPSSPPLQQSLLGQPEQTLPMKSTMSRRSKKSMKSAALPKASVLGKTTVGSRREKSSRNEMHLRTVTDEPWIKESVHTLLRSQSREGGGGTKGGGGSEMEAKGRPSRGRSGGGGGRGLLNPILNMINSFKNA